MCETWNLNDEEFETEREAADEFTSFYIYQKKITYFIPQYIKILLVARKQFNVLFHRCLVGRQVSVFNFPK